MLIIGSIHGDETAGTFLIWELFNHVRKHPELAENRRIILIPLANPDGMISDSRYNARGIDLNRNFSTANRKSSKRHGSSPLSEPETRIIAKIIDKFGPNRIMSIHQPLECMDYDGPGKNLAHNLSGYCDLPVRKLGSKPGSLGSYAGETLDIPIITLELPQMKYGLDSRVLWDKYGKTMRAFILDPGSQQFAK